MSSHMRRIIAIIASLVFAIALIPGVAMANLDSWPDPVGVTTTNPNPGPDNAGYATSWWRQGWGNSLFPDLRWNLPAGYDTASDGQILGQLYTVDRDPFTTIDTTTPGAYLRSTWGNEGGGPYGTNFDASYDILGTYLTPPLSGWPPAGPGTHSPLEGVWWIHASYYSSVRYSNLTMSVPMGIDITPPDPVTGLKVSMGPGEPAKAGPIPSSRAHITWDPNLNYDSLSGAGYYKILIDDHALDDATQGRVYAAPWLPTPDSFTIENFPAGRHKISVVVVDRATNESSASVTYFASDPDTPTVSFTSPLNGYLGVHTIISADASDAAGSPRVSFSIDGTEVATFTAPPYSYKPNLTSITAGDHVLGATATDSYGRSVTVTETVSTTSLPGSVGFNPSDWESLNSVSATGTGTIGDTGSLLGWVNKMRPSIFVTPINPDPAYPDEGSIAGIIYTVDKSADSTINISTPEKYFRQTWANNSSDLNITVDLLSVLNFPPVGGWPPPGFGENSAAEGQWYFHFVPYTTGGFAGSVTQKIPFKVDLTQPSQATSVVVSPSLSTSDAGTWTSGSRAHVSWNIDTYDLLSGMWHYLVTIDGQSATGGIIDGAPGTFTIEDMPAGQHLVGVTTVDNAGNLGTAASAYFYSDPDTPTITLTSPINHVIDYTTTITVDATDAAGDPTVVFKLDSTTLATDSAAPYSLRPDVFALPPGAHILSATATDHLGRSATTTTAVTVIAPAAPSIAISEPSGSSLVHSGPITAVPGTNTVEPHVTIQMNGAVLLDAFVAPFTVVPDLTSLAAGSYEITATVVDRFGRSALATKSVTWTPPLPTVSFTSPAGSSISSGVPVVVSAASAAGDPVVTISLDATTVGTFATPPYAVVPDLSHVAEGSHTLTAVATNAYGSTIVTKAVTWNPIDYETALQVEGSTVPDTVRRWLNNPYPLIGFSAAANPGAPVVDFGGFEYVLGRSAVAQEDFPLAAHVGYTPLGTPLTAATLDVNGWAERAGAYFEPGMNPAYPGEGRWYLTARSVALSPAGYGRSHTTMLGFDFTHVSWRDSRFGR